MSQYKHILAAIDLTNDAELVLEKAISLANAYGATLSAANILEPLSYAYGGDIPLDLTEVQQELHKHAHQQLSELARIGNIPANQQHVSIGKPATEIHNIAEEIGADLIVVGSHGKHGLQLLLGSTANGVLHGAHCDVMAVRVKDRK